MSPSSYIIKHSNVACLFHSCKDATYTCLLIDKQGINLTCGGRKQGNRLHYNKIEADMCSLEIWQCFLFKNLDVYSVTKPSIMVYSIFQTIL